MSQAGACRVAVILAASETTPSLYTPPRWGVPMSFAPNVRSRSAVSRAVVILRVTQKGDKLALEQ
jgi:hypothetical protein